MTHISCAHLVGTGLGVTVANKSIEISGDRIAGISSAEDGGDNLVMPAIANAHDHARATRPSQTGSYDIPLEAWLPYLQLIPAVDPWLASAVSFGRTALGGVGSVMAHYTRVQGLTDYRSEAHAVAKAARDIGIRIAFAVVFRDRNPLLYDSHDNLLSSLSPEACSCVTRRFLGNPLSAREQVELVEAVAADIEGDGVTVQYGPAAAQWCSDELLAAISEGSARSNRRVHMHLLESRYQRLWADRTFPDGIVKHLDRLGLLNPRISFAHGTWLRPEEMELIAERGATIAINTGSNLILNSGIAPVNEMLRRGCRIAMGLDGMSFDEDEDALREMRLGYAIHKGRGFQAGLTREHLEAFVFRNGRFAITGDDTGGRIEDGAPADLLVLDWRQLSQDLIDPDVPAMDVFLAHGRRKHIKELYVAGRPVVANGQVCNVDLPALEEELLAQFHAARHTIADLRAAMPELRAAIASHYDGPLYCS